VSYAEAGVAALTAGCDMVLLCNQSVQDPPAVDQLLDGVAEAQLKGWWQPSGSSEQRRLALLPATPGLSWGELMASPDYIRACCLKPSERQLPGAGSSSCLRAGRVTSRMLGLPSGIISRSMPVRCRVGVPYSVRTKSWS
jgi:hypothetical protein